MVEMSDKEKKVAVLLAKSGRRMARFAESSCPMAIMKKELELMGDLLRKLEKARKGESVWPE